MTFGDHVWGQKLMKIKRLSEMILYQQRKLYACFSIHFCVYWCSTSPPGGDQVDGLPPAPVGMPGRTWPFGCRAHVWLKSNAFVVDKFCCPYFSSRVRCMKSAFMQFSIEMIDENIQNFMTFSNFGSKNDTNWKVFQNDFHCQNEWYAYFSIRFWVLWCSTSSPDGD